MDLCTSVDSDISYWWSPLSAHTDIADRILSPSLCGYPGAFVDVLILKNGFAQKQIIADTKFHRCLSIFISFVISWRLETS